MVVHSYGDDFLCPRLPYDVLVEVFAQLAGLHGSSSLSRRLPEVRRDFGELVKGLENLRLCSKCVRLLAEHHDTAQGYALVADPDVPARPVEHITNTGARLSAERTPVILRLLSLVVGHCLPCLYNLVDKAVLHGFFRSHVVVPVGVPRNSLVVLPRV